LSKCHRGRSTIGEYKKKATRLYVLGNGPSLTKDLERYGEEMMAGERLVVNFMGLASEYKAIKPNLYVLADPIFFLDPDCLPEVSKEKVAKLQKVLQNETDWPMILVTLGDQSETVFVKTLASNRNITLLYAFTGVPVPSDIQDFSGWLRNRYSPPSQNIINYSLYLGIVWRYSDIYLLGADTSFHTMVHVEQDTNRLYMEDVHFYGVEKRYMYKDPEQLQRNTMSFFFWNVHQAFLWYEKIREFADWAGVKIVNASSFSWIDCFERPAERR
jgi:hypothetical protein